MRDRMPTIANSDLAAVDALQARYTLENTSNTTIVDGGPYPHFNPDYIAKPFAGMQRFFRYTIPPQNEREHPTELQILKIGLNNPMQNAYTATPTGRTVPLSFFVANPAGSRYRESPVGIAQPEAPEINQGGVTGYLRVVSSVFRRR